ncbi:MAG TPA: TolC family protein, partial [bacterium]|nr:TolC family protein [bacterium]
HPSVAAAQQALAAAQARLVEAQAAQNIQITVTAQSSYGNAATIPTGGPATNTNGLPVAASMSLIDRQVYYTVKQAEAAVASLAASYTQARQDIALAAAQAYFSVLQAQAVVAARQAAVARADAQVRQAAAQVSAGVAARADVLQAQATLAAAQVDLIAARNQVETARTQLQAAMGRPLTESVVVAAPIGPPVVPQSRDQVVAGAPHRPEVVRSQADVAGAEAALSLAQVRADPLFTMAAASTVDVLKDPTRQVVWTIGASVTYYLSDGGRAQATVAEARANLATAQAKETQALQSAQVDALSAWILLQDAQARVVAGRASETAAAEALRAAEGRYQAGVGTIVEVLIARAAAESAILSRIQAEFDAQSASLRLRYVVGQPVIEGD